MNIGFQKTHQRSFGTWPLKGDVLRDAIGAAVGAGYRAFDTAQGYASEDVTGAALIASGIPRDELCITTKVMHPNYSESRFIPSVEASLKALQVSVVDILLLHWPTPGGDIALSLRLLQQAHDRGLARNIGISNHTVAMMRQAAASLHVAPVTNQVEFHPLIDQSKLLAAAQETGIPLSAYCSVARGEVFKYPIFAQIGAGYGKSAAQIVLRWILQKGVCVTTMSTKPENIRANFDVMDFTLSSIDMARIDAMTATGLRLLGKAEIPWGPDWD